MHKKRLSLTISAMAILMAISSPTAVLASAIENPEQETIAEVVEEAPLEEEIIEVPIEEEILSGTLDVDENQVLTGVSNVAETAAPAMNEALQNAETYIQKNITSPIVSSIGGEWAVTAMARCGYLTEQAKTTYLANLYKVLQDKKGVLDKVKYTEYSRVVIALSSLGIDARSVNDYNLVEPLADFRKVSNQGINGSTYALIALDTRKYEIPAVEAGKEQTTREKLIADILGQEISGGGWALLGDKADVDITAMVIQSLVPYMNRADVKAAVNRGIDKLAAMQDADGGYSSEFISDDKKPIKNLESSAQTVIALSAVDVSLLQQEKFMKNGKTLVDELLRFQKPDGSFEHVLGAGSDGMATEQGTLALLAWSRAMNGQTRLYDMTDLGSVQDNIPESTEKIEAFRRKIESLPKQITLREKETIFGLKTELDLMNAFDEKEVFADILNKHVENLKIQEDEVKKLDERIWKEINPIQITLKDQKKVEEMLVEWNKIPEANRDFLEREEDLKRAEIIIGKLEDGILAKEIFEIAKVSRKDYIFEENGYKICIKANKIKEPADMSGVIEIQEKDGELYIWTQEEGMLPGEIEVSISCSLKDGMYMLCNDKNTEEEWIYVSGKIVDFDLIKGGSYVMKLADTGFEDKEKPLAGTSAISKKPGTTGRKPVSRVPRKTAKSNGKKVEIKDGMVAKSEFEAIKDKDENLKISGETEKENPYIFTIYGKDMKNAKDMRAGIKEDSTYRADIEKLSENPYIFSFDETDDFPGKMQVELSTGQEDGKYLLMRYNTEKKQADYIQKVEVKDKKTKFIVEKGGDYFITKKAKTQSLDEIEAEEKEEPKEEQLKEESTQNQNMEEEVLEGTKEESALPIALLIGGGIFGTGGIGAGLWYYTKRK